MTTKVYVEDTETFCALAEDCGLSKTCLPVRYQGVNFRVFIADSEEDGLAFVDIAREAPGHPHVWLPKVWSHG